MEYNLTIDFILFSQILTFKDSFLQNFSILIIKYYITYYLIGHIIKSYMYDFCTFVF